MRNDRSGAPLTCHCEPVRTLVWQSVTLIPNRNRCFDLERRTGCADMEPVRVSAAAEWSKPGWTTQGRISSARAGRAGFSAVIPANSLRTAVGRRPLTPPLWISSARNTEASGDASLRPPGQRIPLRRGRRPDFKSSPAATHQLHTPHSTLHSPHSSLHSQNPVLFSGQGFFYAVLSSGSSCSPSRRGLGACAPCRAGSGKCGRDSHGRRNGRGSGGSSGSRRTPARPASRNTRPRAGYAG